MKLEITTIPAGYVGWTMYPADVISEAIAYGERFEREVAAGTDGDFAESVLQPGLNLHRLHPKQAQAVARWSGRARARMTNEKGQILCVSHAFLCIGNGRGIEAHMETGVQQFTLDKYANDPKCHLYFRKPRGWTPELGTRLANNAAQTPPFGLPYDLRLIGAMAFNYSLLGHALNVVSGNRVKRVTCRLAHQDQHFICSMAVAFEMQRAGMTAGCLRYPCCTIDPQQLFDDGELFEPEILQASGGRMPPATSGGTPDATPDVKTSARLN